MDCKTARLLLPFLRPLAPELSPTDAEDLRDHLAGCPECGALAAAEHRVDARLGQAVRDVPVPADLPARLLKRLDAERRSWYRRRVVAPLLAAAALLLATGAGWFWLRGSGTAIDIEMVAFEQSMQPGTGPEQIEQAFAGQGVRVSLPRDFNYALLTSYDLVRFQGHDRVPRLEFARGEARAYVYVLTAPPFNLKAEWEQHTSGGVTVEIRKPLGQDDYAYLLVYTAGALDRFRLDQPGGI